MGSTISCLYFDICHYLVETTTGLHSHCDEVITLVVAFSINFHCVKKRVHTVDVTPLVLVVDPWILLLQLPPSSYALQSRKVAIEDPYQGCSHYLAYIAPVFQQSTHWTDKGSIFNDTFLPSNNGIP